MRGGLEYLVLPLDESEYTCLLWYVELSDTLVRCICFLLRVCVSCLGLELFLFGYLNGIETLQLAFSEKSEVLLIWNHRPK